MGDRKNYKEIKIVPDLERIIPDRLAPHSRRLLQEHIDRYMFAKAYTLHKKVADIACGSGYGSNLIANGGARKVIGIDSDESTIRYAKKRYRRQNVIYKVGDAHCLDMISQTIDVVISFETIEHMKHPMKFLSEVKRVLKRSGTLLISTPNSNYSMRDNPFHLKEYALKELNHLLGRYFRSIILFGQRPVFEPIMRLYHFLSRIIPPYLLPLLQMRPWEKLDIRKLDSMHEDGYLYFIAVCQK
jgi:2-polyprenyl-3-methyl-5-hydroxy-6-metoxy-1,4-benzoquinol methylase